MVCASYDTPGVPEPWQDCQETNHAGTPNPSIRRLALLAHFPREPTQRYTSNKNKSK